MITQIHQSPPARIVIAPTGATVIQARPQLRLAIKHSGPPGRDGAGLGFFEHVQGAAAQIWIVNHNLGRRPAAVSVRSVGGVEVIAHVVHVSTNQLQIMFAAPVGGSALIQ